MSNKEVAEILRRVKAAYIIKKKDRFRIRAYDIAAESIEKNTQDIKDLWKQGKLDDIKGVGKTIAAHLNELLKKGKAKNFEKAFKDIPKSTFVLMELPGFGPKTAYILTKKLNLKNPKTAVKDLLKAARENKIAVLENFGPKSQKKIISYINRYKRIAKKKNRMLLPQAWEIAEELISFLSELEEVINIQALGSLRRMEPTIGDIDIAVSTVKPSIVIERFISFPKKVKLLEKGETGASIILGNDKQIDLRVVKPERYGSMLQYFTGSKDHNIALREWAIKKGYSLSEYGIKPRKRPKDKSAFYNKIDNIYEFDNEKKFYRFLDLQYIPPEIRQNEGEIEAASNDRLPNPISSSEIKGDLHIHSDFNIESSHDYGISSFVEIIKKAESLHYEYIGFSDHNPSVSNHKINDILSIMKARKAYFEQKILSTKGTRVHYFNMLEIDILKNGSLGLPNSAFKYIDCAIASIHSAFRLTKDEMTKRILKGLEHPKVKIMGHPTGRILEKREGIKADWEKIMSFCSKKNKAMEINSFPDRLDLFDQLIRMAINKKVKLVINTDSHHKDSMDNIKYGIAMARRGWAQKSDILNTLEYNKIYRWLTSQN